MKRDRWHNTQKAVLVLSLWLFCSLFGCQTARQESSPVGIEQAQGQELALPAEKKDIRLCLDLFHAYFESDIRSFLDQISARVQGCNVAYESLPLEEPERSAALTRLRTEIMSGKGPDIFVCSCPFGSADRVFPYPKQAAKNRLFLCLDDYISEAEEMDWNYLFSPVMEAGRTEEGQQLLPLTYEFSLRMLDASASVPDVERPMTWMQMVNSQTPSVQSAARRGLLGDVFGELGDYSRDIPAFTEEEFLARAMEYMELEDNGEGEQVHWYDGWLTNGESPLNMSEGGQSFFMLPTYNVSGGITANITAFAAISRNTEYPAECFQVLDYLLSQNAQQNDNIYALLGGWPVHRKVGSEEVPWRSRTMSKANFEEFSTVREQINAVKFYTPLDKAIWDISALWHSSEQTPEALEEIVHTQYTKMEMMLAES